MAKRRTIKKIKKGGMAAVCIIGIFIVISGVGALLYYTNGFQEPDKTGFSVTVYGEKVFDYKKNCLFSYDDGLTVDVDDDAGNYTVTIVPNVKHGDFDFKKDGLLMRFGSIDNFDKCFNIKREAGYFEIRTVCRGFVNLVEYNLGGSVSDISTELSDDISYLTLIVKSENEKYSVSLDLVMPMVIFPESITVDKGEVIF